MTDRKTHWETVYETKQPQEVSWTQAVPERSLEMIRGFGVPKEAKIIDIGGGDSRLADFLMEEGYTDITVLDISAKALERARARLGDKAEKAKWIATDITLFEPAEQYDVWHDRAAFHFLTEAAQVEKYISITEQAVRGYMVIGTFSDQGPKKCSGLEVQQYNEAQLAERFAGSFEKIACVVEDHTTPFDTQQNFVFCSFKKK